MHTLVLDVDAMAIDSTPREPMLVTAGIVERGDQRGRLLGFPTANVQFRRRRDSVAEGVYSGVALTAAGQRYRAAVSLGRRPSFFADGVELFEVHLLGFDGDLYGQRLEVAVFDRLRGQAKFGSVGELIAALRADVARVAALIPGALLQ